MAHYYGVTRSGNELSHYGVKGMKWGVRKAILSGNQRALDRHYRKAAKKLAKLTDLGLNSKKYAAKAAAYGAAAAGTGTLAVGGTMLARKAMADAGSRLRSTALKSAIYSMTENKHPLAKSAARYFAMGTQIAGNKLKEGEMNLGEFAKRTYNIKIPFVKKKIGKGKKVVNKIPVSGETLYRIGAGAVTAGLAAKSAQNAYRATHSAKYRAKAKAWRDEMDSAFKGTQYEGRYDRPKRRKRKSRL